MHYYFQEFVIPLFDQSHRLPINWYTNIKRQKNLKKNTSVE